MAPGSFLYRLIKERDSQMPKLLEKHWACERCDHSLVPPLWRIVLLELRQARQSSFQVWIRNHTKMRFSTWNSKADFLPILDCFILPYSKVSHPAFSNEKIEKECQNENLRVTLPLIYFSLPCCVYSGFVRNMF